MSGHYYHHPRLPSRPLSSACANGQRLSLVDFTHRFARKEYSGDRTRFVIGPALWHAHGVAMATRTQDQIVVAYLHDVVELHLKRRLKKADPAFLARPENKKLRDQRIVREEAFIAHEIRRITAYYRAHGYAIDHLKGDLDAMTARSYLEHHDNIQRVIDRGQTARSPVAPVVKAADMRSNSLPERNPRPAQRSARDQKNLTKYETGRVMLNSAFGVLPLITQHQSAIVNGVGIKTRKLPGSNTGPGMGARKGAGAHCAAMRPAGRTKAPRLRKSPARPQPVRTGYQQCRRCAAA